MKGPKTHKALKLVNIGCGQTPTPAWLNYDNSLSVRLARHRFLVPVLEKLPFLDKGRKSFLSFARNSGILWADATKHIPLADDSVEVLYTSHMVEHLDRVEIKQFLQEAYRILASDGIIRIVVPDLRKLVDQYCKVAGDADLFVEKTLLARSKPKTFLERLTYLIIGDRHHLWMYDGPAICRLLSARGFKEPSILDPGSTTIPGPGELNLFERADESVYVEAFK